MTEEQPQDAAITPEAAQDAPLAPDTSEQAASAAVEARSESAPEQAPEQAPELVAAITAAIAEQRAGGSKMTVSAADDLPIVEQDGEWDMEARKGDILEWAGWPDDGDPDRARRGFLMVDETRLNGPGGYFMPFAIVRDGGLVASTAGVRACMSMMDELPDGVSNEAKREARGMLMGYMGKASKKREADLIAATVAATIAALEERAAADTTIDPQRAAPPPPHQPAPPVTVPAAPPVTAIPGDPPATPEDDTPLDNRDPEPVASDPAISDPDAEIAGAAEAVAEAAAEAMTAAGAEETADPDSEQERAAPVPTAGASTPPAKRPRTSSAFRGGNGSGTGIDPRPRRGTVELRYAEWKGDEPGGFDGYASTAWHVDSYGTAFAPGAWRKTLNERRNRVVVLWQHYPQNPIGYPVALEEDTYGLRAKARIVEETSLGREAMALLRAGVPMGLSVGFRTIRERPAQPTDPLILDHAPEAIRQDPSKAFVITEAALYEFSVVTFPANEAAAVDAVREADIAHRSAGRLASLADLLVDLRAGRLRPEEEPMLAEFVAAWNDRAPGAVPQEPLVEESAPPAPLTDPLPPTDVQIAPRARRIDLDIALARYRGLADRNA